MFEQRRLLEDKVSDETVKILRLVILLLLSGFASTSFSADLSSAMTLSFVMDDQQKKTLDEYSKYASDGRFSVSVEIDGHSSLIPATVHLRGQGSRVLCDRKSFTVNFSGDFNHTLIRNSDSKGYYLLSMCQDRLFLRTLTVFRIWKELGLFPLAFRYVELKFNNESRGLYILLEKPVSGLLRQYPALTSVLRRGFFTNTDSTRVVYTTSTANIATGDYVRSFQDLDYLSEEDQISRLTEVLDLDQYLTHLAVAAIVRNGDYVDELYFYRVAGEKSAAQDRHVFRVMGWDPEDIFKKCHWGGKYAFKDQWGIAYCVESSLGKLILSNQSLYLRFVETVGELLEGTLSLARFHQTIEVSLTETLAAMRYEDVVKPMVNFWNREDHLSQQKTLSNAHEILRHSAEVIKTRFTHRHNELKLRMKRYQLNQRLAR